MSGLLLRLSRWTELALDLRTPQGLKPGSHFGHVMRGMNAAPASRVLIQRRSRLDFGEQPCRAPSNLVDEPAETHFVLQGAVYEELFGK